MSEKTDVSRISLRVRLVNLQFDVNVGANMYLSTMVTIVTMMPMVTLVPEAAIAIVHHLML